MCSVLVLIIFFLYSVGYNIFGVLAADIIEGCKISLSSAGLLQSFFQIGALLGIGLSPLALMKLSSLNRLRIGIFFDAVGMILLAIIPSSLSISILFVFMGLGGFYIDSGANAYLAETFPNKRQSLIPLLHFSYSLGALLCGYLVLPFKSPTSWGWGYGIVGVTLAFLFVLGYIANSKNPKEVINIEVEKEVQPVPTKKILSDKNFIMYCIVIMMYMASQQTCSSWLPLFIEKDFNASASLVAATTMSFWIGIAVMRLISPILLKTGKINAMESIQYGMLISFFAMLGISLSTNIAFALICSAICGFGAGAVIPLFIVEVSSWYPGNTGFISTFYIVVGTIGRFIFPYLVAFFGDRYGMRIALGASSLLLFVGTVLAFVVTYRKKHE